ncbi:MAG: 3-dehydroquinate synthase [Lutisporaceae bacterium]
MSIINIKLKDNSYDIYVQQGLLQHIGKLVSAWYKGKNISIITDTNVDLLYGEKLSYALKQYDYKVSRIVVSPGEQSKSISTLSNIYNRLTEHGITRNSLIIALGGGVIGDLTGFAAATFLRGVSYIQIPTTVMSQLDSSIGGKTAINIEAGKNLAGCFYQPKAVYIDTLLLETLPDRFFSDGLAEAVKYGAIKDVGLFNMLSNMKSLGDIKDNIDKIIYRCASIKCELVNTDEFDKGERMLLNFGHTIGHGLEKFYDYNTYTHGEAVSLGILIITKNSENMGLTAEGSTKAISELLTKCHLPITHDKIDKDKLLHIIRTDKKSEEAFINLILLKKLGCAYIYKASKDDLINFI